MDYFNNIPDISYRFGNETTFNNFVDLTAYVSIVDEIKDNVSFYNPYYIREAMRPDQVSIELYGTPIYHWTFFFMNDKLKEFGWPIDSQRLLEKAQHTYFKIAMQTTSDLTNIMKVGQNVQGVSSGATGIVDSRNLDFGIIYVDKTSVTDFRSSENIFSVVGDVTTEIGVTTSEQYNSPAYYKDANGDRADFDPLVGPGALLTEVTRLEQLTEENEDLRSIKVIKPNLISQVVSSFKQALST